ncbi:hypothetical protein [Hymenobacter ruricola]|uniref:Uncharacterized protein n=1 Tax=Hymenobacter ruricola TaxID=2791023 RepID=A0ABS0IAB4_9BACT|nr:hypothetical protein [Hymenobacter ruricola]MBF9223686.1 hypothetical protein [Hymenobacter ruricola]
MIVRLTERIAPQCLSIHPEPELYLYDPPLPEREEGSAELIKRQPTSKREGSPQLNDFTVRNQTASPVHLVKIDCCLYSSGDGTRCDCALAHEQQLRFVEFSHGVFRRRSARVEKCIPQLAASINDFYDLGIIPAGSVVQAIICVGFTEDFPPRTAMTDIRTVQLNQLVKAPVAVELRVSDETTFA